MTNRDKFSYNNQNDKPATSTPLRPLYQSLFLWTLLIACFAAWDIHQTEKYEGKAVSALLHESFNKDLVYRKWATMHGGVYVPITERTPPMGMPVMDGYALLQALNQLNPKLPIIISSGFGDADVTSRTGTDIIAGLISKPYNPNQLQDVLKSALEGKGG